MDVAQNRFVHENMNEIENVKVHLRTRSGKVNIKKNTVGKQTPVSFVY